MCVLWLLWLVCAGGCGLGMYLYKFEHSCACDTRINGLWWLTCLQWPSSTSSCPIWPVLHFFSPRRSAQCCWCAVHLPMVITMSHSWVIDPIWSRYLCGNAWLWIERFMIVCLRWLNSSVWPIKLIASLISGLGSICLTNRQMWYHNCGLKFYLLPGFNCGVCKFMSCFAYKIMRSKCSNSTCCLCSLLPEVGSVQCCHYAFAPLLLPSD